ncbi:MAG: endolytic transglycosylase MltG [Chromatiales bacterium]|nr:endolytic transglycosylase MltG [Chromatiales bacterium]
MISRIIGLFIITVSFLGAWVMMDFNQFKTTPLNIQPGGIAYLLEPGTSVTSLAKDLADQGVLDNPLYLRVLARLEGSAAKIKAGEYQIPEGTTPLALLNLLVAGEVINHSLTLIEGWSFREVRQAVAEHTILEQTLTDLTDEEVMIRLGRTGEHPEGRFLPDTYHFPRGTTDLAFLKRALEAMDRVLTEKWKKREKNLPLKSPYEALILASIIEKETGLATERPEIAGVFIRRLRKGMKLQTDPTVIYGMGDQYNGNIRRKDLRTDTPYNTYTRKGLTPTPIAMPGALAIEAALHPKPGKSLYFVAKGDGSGSHYFSSTLKEHNRAVRKYQLKK